MIVALLLLTAAPSGAAVSSPAPGSPVRPRVVMMDLASNGVDANAVRTISDVLATAFGRHGELDFVSASDLRAMMDVEAAKQAASCDNGESCLAELASALGADLVVHGSVGQLGGLTVVNLSLFDARKSRALGREKIQSTDMGQLSTLLDQAVDRLTAHIEGVAPVAPPPAPSSSLLPPADGTLLFSGVGVGAAGVLVGAFGGYFAATSFSTLETATTTRAQKTSANGAYPLALTATIAGGAATAAGLGLVGTAFVLGDGK